jgi:hypothetical protein
VGAARDYNPPAVGVHELEEQLDDANDVIEDLRHELYERAEAHEETERLLRQTTHWRGRFAVDYYPDCAWRVLGTWPDCRYAMALSMYHATARGALERAEELVREDGK